MTLSLKSHRLLLPSQPQVVATSFARRWEAHALLSRLPSFQSHSWKTAAWELPWSYPFSKWALLTEYHVKAAESSAPAVCQMHWPTTEPALDEAAQKMPSEQLQSLTLHRQWASAVLTQQVRSMDLHRMAPIAVRYGFRTLELAAAMKALKRALKMAARPVATLARRAALPERARPPSALATGVARLATLAVT